MGELERKIRTFLEDKVLSVLLLSPVKSYLCQVTQRQYTQRDYDFALNYIKHLPMFHIIDVSPLSLRLYSTFPKDQERGLLYTDVLMHAYISHYLYIFTALWRTPNANLGKTC